MVMIRESEVREKMRDVLLSRLALDDFEDWLTQHSWNMHLDSDPNVQGLVTSVQLALDEYSVDTITEAELLSLFGDLLDEVSIMGVEVFQVGVALVDANIARPRVRWSIASSQVLLLTP